MESTWLLERLTFVIPLLLSLTVHEWAHAFSAFKLGDDTAARMGRLTLNPIPHIDPIGTLLLPLLGIPFGWAKPVPVNPARFNRKVRMRTGMMITAAAGPFSNVVLAVACTVALALVIRARPETLADQPALIQFLQMGMMLNLLLACFNMLPIYPLDGSRVVDGLISERLRPAWERFAQYSPILLIGVILAPRMLGVSLFAWPMRLGYSLLYLLVGI